MTIRRTGLLARPFLFHSNNELFHSTASGRARRPVLRCYGNCRAALFDGIELKLERRE